VARDILRTGVEILQLDGPIRPRQNATFASPSQRSSTWAKAPPNTTALSRRRCHNAPAFGREARLRQAKQRWALDHQCKIDRVARSKGGSRSPRAGGGGGVSNRTLGRATSVCAVVGRDDTTSWTPEEKKENWGRAISAYDAEQKPRRQEMIVGDLRPPNCGRTTGKSGVACGRRAARGPGIEQAALRPRPRQ